MEAYLFHEHQNCRMNFFTVACPALTNPKNGEVYINNKQDKAIFVCDQGFELVGDGTVSCVNGGWSSSPPRCT